MRSFAYFRKNTSAQFAAPFGNEFWEYLVLQIGERERCVKHALVALGALHESFTDEHLRPFRLQSSAIPHLPRRSNWKLTNVAIESYTRALGALKKHILPDTYDGLHISLLCSILFTSFEWLRGSYDAATTHLQSGLCILCQWSASSTSISTPTAHFIRKQLVPMFIRLSIQARSGSPNIVPIPWLSNSRLATAPSDKSRNRQEHLRAARDSLDLLCGEVYLQPSTLNLHIDLALSQTAAFDFSIRLAKWCAEYHEHLLPLPLLPQEDLLPEKINLTLWYTVLSILQATSFTMDTMIIDAYTSQCRHIVHLARLLSESSVSPPLVPSAPHAPLHKTYTPRFRIDMEVIPMLYYVASKCRHPAIRREAIALLRDGARREGLWDGWAAAALAEEILTVEEEGVEGVPACGPEGIPQGQRVIMVDDVTDLQGRTTRVRFQRWGDADYGEWRTLKW